MKKIISLTMCLLVLFLFCMPAYASDDSWYRSRAIEFIGYAERELDENDYSDAAQQYTYAAGFFEALEQRKGYDIAYYLYGRAADLYEKDLDEREARGFGRGDDSDVQDARKDQEYIVKHKGDAVCLPVSDFFDENGRLKPNVGASTLSEGSIAIIVGVASAAVFGIAGFALGKVFEKKKHA